MRVICRPLKGSAPSVLELIEINEPEGIIRYHLPADHGWIEFIEAQTVPPGWQHKTYLIRNMVTGEILLENGETFRLIVALAAGGAT